MVGMSLIKMVINRQPLMCKVVFGVVVDENVSELNFYYLTPGLKTGIIVSGIGFIGLLGLLVLDIKKKKYDK